MVCPLKKLHPRAADKPRAHILEENLPAEPGRICTQHSVSFPAEIGRRERQAYVYKSPEWETFHSHARNTIESLNNGIKHGGTFADPTRRQARGLVSAQIIMTILLVNYNIRRIAKFLKDEAVQAADTATGLIRKLPAIRPRDRDFYNRYIDSYPAGVKRPEDNPPRRT